MPREPILPGAFYNGEFRVQACEARRQDTEVHVLVCLTNADVEYRKYLDAAERKNTTAAELFTESFEKYKRELLARASEAAGNAGHLEYISASMHACCFGPSLQDEKKTREAYLVRELMNVNVKNVAWVKKWCVDKLSTINSSKRHSGNWNFNPLETMRSVSSSHTLQ